VETTSNTPRKGETQITLSTLSNFSFPIFDNKVKT
jgi:hypothetical protein